MLLHFVKKYTVSRLHGGILHNSIRFLNCNSCGIELQNKDPKDRGYYILPRVSENHNKIQKLKDVKYLLFSQDIQKLSTDIENDLKEDTSIDKIKKVEHPLICKRCFDVTHQNKYDICEFHDISLDQVLSKIPKQSNLMMLVPLSEFPFHFNRKLFFNKNYNTSLIFTKSDQIISKKSFLEKQLPTFFRQFISSQFDVKKNLMPNITAISALKSWNIQALFSRLKYETYFVGNANTGKSTLINSLLSLKLGYKLFFDRKGGLRKPDLKDDQLTNLPKFINSQKAGISYVPNMTRDIQPYKIGEKIIFDLPGFNEDMDPSLDYLESLIDNKWLQRIRKTNLFKNGKIKKKRYISYNGTENGSCLTLGGIFYLVAPPNTVNQISNYILGGETSEFRNIDKAIEVFSKCNSDDNNEGESYSGSKHPLSKYCGVLSPLCDKSKFIRHIIPPFQGSIEVVIKDLGFFTMKSTGRYKYSGLYEIWLPRELQVCIREPLEKTIDESFEYSKDEKKREIFTYPRDRPLISSTYPMDHYEVNTLSRMKEMYIERTSHDLTNQRLVDKDPFSIVNKLQDTPQNLYWYYKW